MMTNDKDKLLEMILGDSELPSDDERFTMEDLECNDLLKVVEGIDHSDEPPSHLDTVISEYAQKSIKARKRPAVVYLRLALAAAAALLFTLIVIQLVPIRKAEPSPVVKQGPLNDNQQAPDRSRIVEKQVKPTVAETVPEFDWESDSITKEMVLLEAEIYMDELDYSDAALVENFE